jgi:hypothetical protein
MLTEIPFQPGIYNEDPDFTAKGRYVDGNLVRFRHGFPETIGGWTRFVRGTFDGKCRGLFLWYDLAGTAYVAVGTHTKLYTTTGEALTDITPAGLEPGNEYGAIGTGWGTGPWGDNYWSGAASVIGNIARTWSMANWGEYRLASPRMTTIFVWDPATGGLAVAVEGAPAMIGYLFVTPERFAVALGATNALTDEYDPMLVRWCDQENLYDWSPSALDLSGDHRLAKGSMIIAGLASKHQNLIWTDTSLYTMTYRGDEFVYGFDHIGSGCGLLGVNAKAERDGTAFWMGNNKQFFVYDGGAPRVLDSPISRRAFDELVWQQADLVTAGINPRFNEVWWFYPSDPLVSEVSKYVAYNWVEDHWTIGELARTSWIDGDRYGTPLATSPEGRVYEHENGDRADGLPLIARLRSAPFDIKDGDQLHNIHRVVADLVTEASVRITVTAKRWPRAAEEYRKSKLLTPDMMRIDTRTQGRQSAIEIESGPTGGFWRLGRLRFDITEAGKR